MEYFSLDQQLKKFSRLTLPCHKSTIHSVRWSPNGSYVASGGKDMIVVLHKVAGSEMIKSLKWPTHNAHQGDIDQLCWDPNSSLIATASMDKHVKIWDIRSVDPVASSKLKDENMSVCWSNDGKTIAVSDRADLVSFIEPRTGYKVVKEQKLPFEIGEITWNKEGDLLFVTSCDGKIHLLSYPSLQVQFVIDAFASPCVCIRFDPSGKYFAVGSNDAISSIWDNDNLICFKTIERLDWPIKTVSFSHDSRYLASGSEDNFIDIADVRTGKQASVIDVSAPTLTLDFHPREYILAYALDEQDHREVGNIKVVGFPEKESSRNHN